jgi:predicted transcriptional regulator
LERDGVIEGQQRGKKRVYRLTDKGDGRISAILDSYEKIEKVMTSICT